MHNAQSLSGQGMFVPKRERKAQNIMNCVLCIKRCAL